MAQITDIRPTARGSHRRRVYLDGAEWRSVPQEVVRALGLRTGLEREEAELDAGIAEAEPPQAWERAMRLLNYRDRGSGELRSRLIDDGYTPGVVDEVVERAADLGFLDDRRFAEDVARRAGEKRRGRRRVARELASKGVDDALAAEILADRCSDEDERERALALARRLLGAHALDAPKLAARLARAGFETGTAWSVAREVARPPNSPFDEG